MEKKKQEKPQILAVNEITSGNWLCMKNVLYTDRKGNKQNWEMVSRTTKSSSTIVDSVSIIATIRDSLKDIHDLVLIKQFRIPCQKFIIEFPSGLIDEDESSRDAAVRELLEETGYYGSVESESIEFSSNPSVTDSKMILSHMVIDLEDPRNKNPVSSPDDTEFIEVFRLPMNNLLNSLIQKASDENCSIDSRLYFFATALKIIKN